MWDSVLMCVENWKQWNSITNDFYKEYIDIIM